MAKKQLYFYATKNDLLNVLKIVAAKTDFKYACINHSKNEFPIVYENAGDIPDLAVALYGDQNKEGYCLLIAPDVAPKVRVVEQHDSSVKCFFDQISHPESVVLKPGGVLGNAECIISGQVGSISRDEWSNELYKIISATIKRQFKTIKSFYVGEEALDKLNHGFRLTANIKSPIEYDLHR